MSVTTIKLTDTKSGFNDGWENQFYDDYNLDQYERRYFDYYDFVKVIDEYAHNSVSS